MQKAYYLTVWIEKKCFGIQKKKAAPVFNLVMQLDNPGNTCSCCSEEQTGSVYAVLWISIDISNWKWNIVPPWLTVMQITSMPSVIWIWRTKDCPLSYDYASPLRWSDPHITPGTYAAQDRHYKLNARVWNFYPWKINAASSQGQFILGVFLHIWLTWVA